MNVLITTPVPDEKTAWTKGRMDVLQIVRQEGYAVVELPAGTSPGEWLRLVSDLNAKLGKNDHILHLVRQFERQHPRGRECRPDREAAGLHSGEAGLDAFSDHQDVAGWSKPHSPTPARPEHHPLRIDWRLARPISGKKGAVDRQRNVVDAPRHQSHHCRPDAA